MAGLDSGATRTPTNQIEAGPSEPRGARGKWVGGPRVPGGSARGAGRGRVRAGGPGWAEPARGGTVPAPGGPHGDARTGTRGPRRPSGPERSAPRLLRDGDAFDACQRSKRLSAVTL